MGIVSDFPLNLHISKYRLEQLSDLTREVSLCCEQQLTEKLTTVSKRVSVEFQSQISLPCIRPHRDHTEEEVGRLRESQVGEDQSIFWK